MPAVCCVIHAQVGPVIPLIGGDMKDRAGVRVVSAGTVGSHLHLVRSELYSLAKGFSDLF